MIARSWRGWTSAADADAYLQYMRQTGLADIGGTKGNLGSIVFRQVSHGRAEFLLISFWTSWDAIKRFAGPQADRAVFYPDDARFLVSKDIHVDHLEVAYADLPRLLLNDG